MFDLCGMSRVLAKWTKHSRPRDSMASSHVSSTGSRLDKVDLSIKTRTTASPVTPGLLSPANTVCPPAAGARLQARVAGQAPARGRAQAPASRPSSVHSAATDLSAVGTIATMQTARSHARHRRALPIAFAMRTEPRPGVETFKAFMPAQQDGPTYDEYAIIDGVRCGRMGTEILAGDDVMGLKGALQHTDVHPDADAFEALRSEARRLLCARAYALIRAEFPEATHPGAICGGGRVELYVPTAERARSRSRDQGRRKRFHKMAIVPPLPTSSPVRGRSPHARPPTPSFFSVPGLSGSAVDDL